MLHKFYDIKSFEIDLISKTNRFKITTSQKKEILIKFKNKNHLIIGAAGSIGSVFSKLILLYQPYKVFFLDKDENQLTELNREINLLNSNSSKEFICYDILNLDIKNFCIKNKIYGIYNFSALKHVRSEENIFSSNYMLKINSAQFLKIVYPKSVKYIFSVSTDKANNPTSLLGLSKKLMEHTLYEIKKKNQKKKICSVRFTNVSFSKGSILKSIYDKCITGGTFGIPSNVKRHFITHNEAASLCFKSVLKECENSIILPNPDKIGDAKSILVLCKKILKKFNINFKRKSSGYYSKGLKVKFVKALTYGQKDVEDLKVNDEIYSNLKDDMLIKTSFKKLKNYDLVVKKIKDKKFFNTNKLIKLFSPDFRSGNHKKIKLSENI
jgi:FlaA1/EpsC-like NDP-sugar epimerase